MDGPAPAIINAIVDALGVEFDAIPLLPEDILQAMTSSATAKFDQAPVGVSR
jgi:CO/xanthine dehydrogenase Mo-binding subunit